MTDNTPQPTPEKIVNSTGKHDALYILGNNSRYHDLEIVYSLTSLINIVLLGFVTFISLGVGQNAFQQISN
jgi:hypothetical protein